MPKIALENTDKNIPKIPLELNSNSEKKISAKNSLELISSKKYLENSAFDNKSDLEIWETFKSGDESAFIYIYSKYFNELINYGNQFTTDINLIEDCVQDLFIKIRKSRNKLGVIKKSIRLYLLISLDGIPAQYIYHVTNSCSRLP